MTKDYQFYFDADVASVFNAYHSATVQQNNNIHQCTPPHSLSFGVKFSFKYNMNGGSCSATFVPCGNGTTVRLTIFIVQLIGARCEAYVKDLSNAAGRILNQYPQQQPYNASLFTATAPMPFSPVAAPAPTMQPMPPVQQPIQTAAPVQPVAPVQTMPPAPPAPPAAPTYNAPPVRPNPPVTPAYNMPPAAPAAPVPPVSPVPPAPPVQPNPPVAPVTAPPPAAPVAPAPAKGNEDITIICPNCSNTISADSLFCTHCGVQINPKGGICNRCGAKTSPNAAFCTTCGNKLR